MNLSTIFTNFLDSNIFKQNEIKEEEEGERKMKANKKPYEEKIQSSMLSHSR